jgi:hypothetical protein
MKIDGRSRRHSAKAFALQRQQVGVGGQRVLQTPGLTAAEQRLILGGNAAGLLKLKT